jgi:predicted ATPase
LESGCNRLQGLALFADRQSIRGRKNDLVRPYRFAVSRSVAAFSVDVKKLGQAHAQLGQFDDAWRCVGEAIAAVQRTREKFYEAEVNRFAGEITLMLPRPVVAKAQEFFDHALSVARQQQARSWELRAAMSMARLWRDQGKRDEARDLLAPVYGWFTEGFDTRDLKEAKTLLDELAA